MCDDTHAGGEAGARAAEHGATLILLVAHPASSPRPWRATPEDARAAIERIDDALAVHQALATLSGDCQEILDRFFARDESYTTIADAIGVPMGTIASRISRCLGKLRAEMEGRNLPAGPSRG